MFFLKTADCSFNLTGLWSRVKLSVLSTDIRAASNYHVQSVNPFSASRAQHVIVSVSADYCRDKLTNCNFPVQLCKVESSKESLFSLFRRENNQIIDDPSFLPQTT